MPINSVHPDYNEYKKAAEYVETFMEGEWAVKAKGEKLLPRLSGQDHAKYEAYKSRAIVYGVVPRTVTALVATAFRKSPAFILPEQMQYLLDDCTGTGVPLESFVMRALQEILVTGRAGILVDMPKEEGGNPFFVLYDGDDIRNYDTEPGAEYVVLENSRIVRKPDDRYEFDEKEGWRELFIEGGTYYVRLWECDDKGEPHVFETSQPLRFNKPLNYIPFYPISSFGVEFEVSLPPMLPLAQLSHKSYMVSATRMNAIHLVGVPTPVVSASIDKDDFGALELGPDSCLLLPADSKAFFLEFSGQGIGSVEKAEKDIIDMMGALGARMLMGQNSSSEKAEGVKDRVSISTSILTSVLTALEAGINKALATAAYWKGVSAPTYCELNKELATANIDANTLNALFSAYQAGSIDLATLFHNLSEGGYIPAGLELKEFDKNLKESTANTLDNTKIV